MNVKKRKITETINNSGEVCCLNLHQLPVCNVVGVVLYSRQSLLVIYYELGKSSTVSFFLFVPLVLWIPAVDSKLCPATSICPFSDNNNLIFSKNPSTKFIQIFFLFSPQILYFFKFLLEYSCFTTLCWFLL